MSKDLKTKSFLSKLMDIRHRPLPFIAVLVTLLIVSVNVFSQQSLPRDPVEQIKLLRQASMYEKAAQIYEKLLDNDPLDIDLHYEYINNHYDMLEIDGHRKDDEKIESYYRKLAALHDYADIGHYCLGLMMSMQRKYEKAMEFYMEVEDSTQKYLNNSIGFVCWRQGKDDRAELHFFREIDNDGFVTGAVGNLTLFYIEKNNMAGLRTLLDNENTTHHMSLHGLSTLAFRTGDIPRYLQLTFFQAFHHIHFSAALIALVICTMWFIYFWRIDIFEHEPIMTAIVALLLGGLSAPFSSVISDVLALVSRITLGHGAFNDLIFSVLHIGVVEELAKFLPVLLIVFLSRQVNEPIDLLIYGSLSALGFATLENSLYFTGYGLSIAFGRFLFSTVAHMVLTSIICYAWALVRYIRSGSSLIAIVIGFAIASVVHGLFDYFILGPLKALSIFSFFIVLFEAIVYGRMITNALNFSPYFNRNLIASRRLHNFNLLLSTSIILLAVTYLYNNFHFSTEIANADLLLNIVGTIISVIVVFGALGAFTLRQSSIMPLFKFRRSKK